MKRILFIIICLLISTSLFAIDIKTGGNIGLNLSGFSGSDWQDMIDVMGWDNKYRLGFEMGAFWEIPVNHFFSIQPELNFLMVRTGFDGFYYQYFDESDTSLGGYTINTISSNTFKIFEIPVLAKLNFGSDKARFFLLAGLMLEIIIGDVSYSTKYDDPYGYGNNDDQESASSAPDNRVILGGAAGLGFSIPAGDGRFIFDFRYRTTFSKVFNDINIIINTFGLRLGYSIDIEF